MSFPILLHFILLQFEFDLILIDFSFFFSELSLPDYYFCVW